MSRLFDFFWPTLGTLSEEARVKASEDLEKTLSAVNAIALSPGQDGAVLLEQARRLADDEVNTRSTIEARGGIYMATIGTLIPIVLFVADALAGDDPGLPVSIAKIVLSLISIAYLVGALRWSSRSLTVRTFHRVGVADIPLIATKPQPELALAKEIFVAVQNNRSVINSKVDAIRMAEKFLWRSIVVLLLLLAVAQLPSGIMSTMLGTPPSPQTVTCKLDDGTTDVFAICKLLSAE